MERVWTGQTPPGHSLGPGSLGGSPEADVWGERVGKLEVTLAPSTHLGLQSLPGLGQQLWAPVAAGSGLTQTQVCCLSPPPRKPLPSLHLFLPNHTGMWRSA